MKFVWEDIADIGHYTVTLYDDKDKMLGDMWFKDFTSEWQQQNAEKNGYQRPYSFEAEYCNGFSHSHGFDYDPDYTKHRGGYHGNCTHTVEDIKRYCEEYLAHLFIIDYEAELKQLQEQKRVSDVLQDMGYTGEYYWWEREEG